jgi:hypothetical protein
LLSLLSPLLSAIADTQNAPPHEEARMAVHDMANLAVSQPM